MLRIRSTSIGIMSLFAFRVSIDGAGAEKGEFPGIARFSKKKAQLGGWRYGISSIFTPAANIL